MLFFQLQALLFLISSIPVFATPIPVAPHGDSLSHQQNIIFSIAEGLSSITLHRLIDSHTDPKLADDVLELEEKGGTQSVWLAKVPFDQPHSLGWSRRAVNFRVPAQVRRVEGWWLAFPTFPNAEAHNKILVHVRFDRDRNVFTANSIDFKPRLVKGSKLAEVARLSDIQGYWYAATTADISEMPADSDLIADHDSIIQVVNDKTIKAWGITGNPGVQHGHTDVVSINEPEFHRVFRGCWIRYPLRNINLNQRREVVCVKWADARWKAFRGTWEVDTSKKA
ncbi:hypothetical protein F5887DRAFT_1235684 [Amanita rubescens]|nr:hypothetical protein F5887DRAFT_1235684 [Amanita rubescens]